jgi:hypothetical protein
MERPKYDTNIFFSNSTDATVSDNTKKKIRGMDARKTGGQGRLFFSCKSQEKYSVPSCTLNDRVSGKVK